MKLLEMFAMTENQLVRRAVVKAPLPKAHVSRWRPTLRLPIRSKSARAQQIFIRQMMLSKLNVPPWPKLKNPNFLVTLSAFAATALDMGFSS